MAAIIAQMTRANRERKKNKCFEIVIGKCMYEIGPFPEKYEPEVIILYLKIGLYAILCRIIFQMILLVFYHGLLKCVKKI